MSSGLKNRLTSVLRGSSGMGYPLFVGLLLLTSILVPPLLLLNMPILIARSAFIFWRQSKAGGQKEGDPAP